MKNKPLNFKKLIQLVVLASFLLSWSSAANGSVICQCDDGHFSVENVYSGPCEHDSEHDENEHHDTNFGCDNVPYSISVKDKVNKTVGELSFTLMPVALISNKSSGSSFLEQNYLSYVLKERRRPKADPHYLSTIILLI